jgi:hypothetical protein
MAEALSSFCQWAWLEIVFGSRYSPGSCMTYLKIFPGLAIRREKQEDVTGNNEHTVSFHTTTGRETFAAFPALSNR